MGRYLVVIVLPFLVLAPCVAAAADWAYEDEYADFHVVVSDTASPSENAAAQEFKRYWKSCTGHEIAVGSEESPGAINVWIGRAGCRFAAELDLDELGSDGYCLRSFVFRHRARLHTQDWQSHSRVPREFKHLVIAGGERRGTLAGVYEFFREYMGVRWLTPEVTHLPPAPARLPKLRQRYVPPFTYRDTNYWPFTRHPEFASVHHFNGNGIGNLSEALGGFSGFAGGFGHTFYSLVDPERYFDAHPEYFSLVNGVRQKKSQLCLTNRGVIDVATASVRKLLRESGPNRRIVSVTQMDWPFWCECDVCAALDKREDSHAGTLIHFVNAIAERIEPEFPEAFIDTFAYTYTRKPPKHVKPRHNVIVRLCSIECDFSKPLADRSSPENRAFQRDIRKWSKITQNLFIWNYTQNWHAFQGPHPNIHVLQPNVAFFAEHGVKGLFEQAGHSKGSDFELLKAYIIGRSVWNPDVDGQGLYDEFMALYYREAAPHIRRYHTLITNKVRDDEYVMGIFSKMEWMDYDTVEKAKAIFEGAFAAAQGDGELLARVKRAYLPVEYAALTCAPEIDVVAGTYILRRPPSLTFDEYWDMLMGYGVTHLQDLLIDEFRERLDGKTPPRYREVPIVTLKNDRYEVWVVPEFRGAILRFRDLASGHEFFKGYRQPLSGQGGFEDWTLMNPADPMKEAVVADEYAVVEETADGLVLEAELEDGLVLRRRVSLPAGDAPLEVRVEVRNAGDTPVRPWVKIHPEFWLPRAEAPELWVERHGVWECEGLHYVLDGTVGVGEVPLAGLSRWALRRAREDVALVNSVRVEEIGGLLYFYGKDRGHMNLECSLGTTALAPGDTRSLTMAYETVPAARLRSAE